MQCILLVDTNFYSFFETRCIWKKLIMFYANWNNYQSSGHLQGFYHRSPCYACGVQYCFSRSVPHIVVL